MFSIQEAKVRRIPSRPLSTPNSQRHSETPKTTARSSEFLSPRQISPAAKTKAEDGGDLSSRWTQQAVMVRLALQEGLIDLMTKFGLSTASERLHSLGKRLENCVKLVEQVSKKKEDTEVTRLQQKIGTLTRLLAKQKQLSTKLAADNEDLRIELGRKGRVERDHLRLQETMVKLERAHSLACAKLEQAGKTHADVKRELEALRAQPRDTQNWEVRVKELQMHSAKLKIQLSVKATALQKSKESLGVVNSTLSEVTQRLLASEALQQAQAQRVTDCEAQIGDLTLQVISLTSQLESEAALSEQSARELVEAREECDILTERGAMVLEDLYVQMENRERNTRSRVHALELIGLVRPKLVPVS